MILKDFLRLTGRNLYADRSAVAGFVEIDESCAARTSLSAISERLDVAYPDLDGCLAGCPDHADGALLLGDILSRVTAAICNIVDHVSEPIAARRDVVRGAVIFGATCHDDRVAPLLKLAFDIVSDVIATQSQDADVPGVFRPQLEEFERFVEIQTLGTNILIVLRSAERRGIPWFRVRFGQEMSLAQLGWGCNARRLNLTRGPGTSYLACRFSHDKSATAKALARIGIPVPRQRITETADEACRAAREIGYPVVVKPLKGAGAQGVAVGLETDESVRRAFADACCHSREILVESVLPGGDHRLLVINGELKAAARRERASVTGDGKSTVKDLLEAFNRDPRRNPGKLYVLKTVAFDADMERTLQGQGLSIDDIPEENQVVVLRSSGNLSSGAMPYDVTDIVHPDNRAAAIRAALAVGLDIAGIDFITTDISRSWRETGGGICEVNDLPGIGIHQVAAGQVDRDYGGMILDTFVPVGDDARIPVAIVVGNRADHVAGIMASELNRQNVSAVLLDRNGISVGGNMVAGRSADLAADVARCLEDPWAMAAILALPLDVTRTNGLGVDRATLTVMAGFEDADADLLDMAAGASQHNLYMLDENAAARLGSGSGPRLSITDLAAKSGLKLSSEDSVLHVEDGKIDVRTLPGSDKTGDRGADLTDAVSAAAAKILLADYHIRLARRSSRC